MTANYQPVEFAYRAYVNHTDMPDKVVSEDERMKVINQLSDLLPISLGPPIFYAQYRILKRTPCGIWIEGDTHDTKRFVNLKAIKKYAHLTKREALLSLRERRKKCISFLRRDLEIAEHDLEFLDRYIKEYET